MGSIIEMAEVRSSNLLEPIFASLVSFGTELTVVIHRLRQVVRYRLFFLFADALPPDFYQEDGYKRISPGNFAEGTNPDYGLNYQINSRNKSKIGQYGFPIYVGIIFENRGKTTDEIENAG